MIVIGAGMAGLLAAAIMRNSCERILEAQESLPDNHSAVLRFKSSIVGDTCNIPFKKVKAIKSYVPWKNKLADVMAYSNKSNGDYRLRSIITADGEAVERYVAPPNFTKHLVESLNCQIDFGYKVSTLSELRSWNQPIISTLPMPLLMKITGYNTDPEPLPEFRSIAGVNVLCDIDKCDIYCSMYVPSPEIGPYRISINGNKMIAEVALVDRVDQERVKDPDALADCVSLWRKQALSLLEVPYYRATNFSFQQQRYMKILPIDERARQRFIIWATDNFQIYSLGRFATWRPSILLDDVVKDVRVIQRIDRHSNYEQKKFEMV